MRKTYPQRNAFKYFTKHKDLSSQKTWIICDCGNKAIIHPEEKEHICKECGQVLKKYDIVDISEQNRLFFYNKLTTLFIDDDILTISFFVVPVVKISNLVPLAHEKGSVNVKLRFNKKTRTSIMYASNPSTPNMRYSFLNGSRFKNITQPRYNFFNWIDIKLHPELIEDFCKFVGVGVPSEDIELMDLAWINRTRDSGSIMRRKRDLFLITNKIIKKTEFHLNHNAGYDQFKTKIPAAFQYDNPELYKEILSIEDDNIENVVNMIKKIEAVRSPNKYPLFASYLRDLKECYNTKTEAEKNLNRIKRWLKTEHEIKNFEALVFKPIFIDGKIEINKLSDSVLKEYKKNPSAISEHQILSLFFKNETFLKKSIKTFKSSRNYAFCDRIEARVEIDLKREDIIFAFSKKARKTNSLECLTYSDTYAIESKIFNFLLKDKSKNIYGFLGKIARLVSLAGRLKNNNIDFIISNDLDLAIENLKKKEVKYLYPKHIYSNRFPSENVRYGSDTITIESMEDSNQLANKLINRLDHYRSFIDKDVLKHIYGGLVVSVNGEERELVFIEEDKNNGGEKFIYSFTDLSKSGDTERMLKALGAYCDRNAINYRYTKIERVMSKKIGKMKITSLKKQKSA